MKTLQATYEAVIKEAREQANWYSKKKGPISTTSRWIRQFAIILVSLGGIFPLVGAATEQDIYGINVTNWGYIAIALAGTLVLVDRFFGYSSAWIRYITAELEIRKQIKEFEMKWKMETCDLDLVTVDCLKGRELMKILIDFSSLIDELVKQETNSWATEFQSNIAELQKTINSKLESTSPGSIKVSITNSSTSSQLKLKLDNLNTLEIIGNVALMRSVSPGPHLVTLTGKNAAGNVEAAEVVNVESAKLASIEIKLP
jgi:hypothetical protein